MDKKHEILKAAFDIFCEKGYNLSVSELAGAVKIKTPSLYSHFGSKDEIIELVIRDEIQRYYASLTEKMLEVKSLSCKEAMKSLFVYVIKYFSKDNRIKFWRAIPFIQNQQLKSISTQLIVDNDRIFKQQMQICFSKGQSNGEIRLDASPGALRLYLCILQGVLDGMLLGSEELVDRSNVDELFEAYWDGIRVIGTN
ncbi:TetR/AcrR family transcriptional regulator [Alkaliphilus oremlandii]|uniref:Transcriptional regulator, TetR family n=1 Tax=Alkaliphilus oremlandii (strain OhILAs) TaxID=350688 RepID=A8MLZ1_ALKOO|nr:TetR/AcrR family transcriptional regulator [Alkaliphilus oremlandii]ABW18158.1 transcriptional regulator, TetR family [Alkaliphilus oremlandii OhILAs]